MTVSFMGYTPKDVVVKDKTMNIMLEENSKLLDEVVVVGYGTMKKRDVTGAITSISSEAIEQKMATNVFEALQGTTAGVQVVSGSGQPGESSSIKIRGTSTFSAEGVTPLYIVDGVPLESIDGINTNDITSMEILKDAASAAIYGSRSANGVIIITTKSGQEGKARIDIKIITRGVHCLIRCHRQIVKSVCCTTSTVKSILKHTAEVIRMKVLIFWMIR